MSRRRIFALSGGIFVILLTIYALSPVRTSYDSRWSIHTAMSLLRGQGGDLRAYLPALEAQKFYAIERYGESYRTLFPIGVSLLAIPAVAVALVVVPNFEDSIQTGVPDRFEKIVASFYGAIAGVLFFLVVFIRFRNLLIALTTTFIFTLCTTMWSVATRALWQHGPQAALLATAMLLMLQARTNRSLIQYVSLPLAMAYIVRPTAGVPIVVFSLYVLLFFREWFPRYLAWAILLAVPWMIFNYHVYGAPLPPYYMLEQLGGTATFGEAMLGHLVSPSRGLFVFSPVLLLSLTGAVLALRAREDRPLHVAFALVLLFHWIAVSRSNAWHAGHSFGSRYMTEVLPLLVYFVAFNFELFGSLTKIKQRALGTVTVLLVAASLFINARGALSSRPWAWNAVPTSIDEDLGRLWDWRDVQFLRGIPVIGR